MNVHIEKSVFAGNFGSDMKPATKQSGHSKGANKPATTGAGAAAKVMAGAASKVCVDGHHAFCKRSTRID